MNYKRISVYKAGLLTAACLIAANSRVVQADHLPDADNVKQEQENMQDGVLMSGGVWEYLEHMKLSGKPAEGIQGTDTFSSSANLEKTEQADETETETETETESEYADLAIAKVKNYVNVRTEANTEGDIIGKIYDGAVAHILETVEGENGQWLQIVSGNVEGYIKAEFFLYGDEAAAVIDDYVTRYAIVRVDRLNVRKEPTTESERIGFVDDGEKIELLEDNGDWLKVQYTDNKTGFVAAEYVTVTEEFVYAKTLEEEAAERAAQKALEERQRVNEAQAAENTSFTITPPSGEYGDSAELRNEIVEYAKQFLGNKYVHGGSSLETGTDCSGFTSLIYAEFGYSLGRTPDGQYSSAGRSIEYSVAQPGDVICYGSGGKCTHVALYIGDGQIIHSANPRKGVVIGQADYDTILGVKNIID